MILLLLIHIPLASDRYQLRTGTDKSPREMRQKAEETQAAENEGYGKQQTRLNVIRKRNRIISVSYDVRSSGRGV